MKHLKRFETEAGYTQFKDTENFVLPNVSYVEETNVVKFNPYVELGNPNVVCTYNITNISYKTQILYSDGLSCFSYMIVDGIEMDVDTHYQFDTVGNHVVEFVLNDPTVIGDYAFCECSSLTSVTIPDSVTWIGSSAFYGCSSLPVIDNIRYADTCLVEVVDKSLTSYSIKEGTRIIGSFAFYSLSNLTNITIPNGVITIGDQAFEWCSSLTSITIPDSVTRIGYSVFSGCESLPVIDNIRYADTYLEEVVDKSLTSYSIKEGTRFIGESAFYECDNITEITIPNSVIDIASGAFSWCNNLTSVTIGNSVTNIGKYAFQECSSLTSITCYASTTPSIQSNTFMSILKGGTLYVPTESDYSSWMSKDYYYLGYYNWTIQYI